MERDGDDKDIENEWEVLKRDDSCRFGDEQEEGGDELAPPQKSPVEARAIKRFEEKADGIVNARDGEAVAENFSDAGGEEAEREEDPGDDGKNFQVSLLSYPRMNAFQRKRWSIHSSYLNARAGWGLTRAGMFSTPHHLSGLTRSVRAFNYFARRRGRLSESAALVPRRLEHRSGPRSLPARRAATLRRA